MRPSAPISSPTLTAGLHKAALIALLAALPALMASVILSLMGVDWADYVPWHIGAVNDALYYWRQVATFAQVGFDGGYYTVNEMPASATFSHFYFYGPVFPMLYGLAGRLFGWTDASGPALNTAIITLALLAYGIANRNDERRLRWALLVVATCWPLLLFVPTTMQEGVHMALAILLAASFTRLLREQQDAPVWLKAGVWLLLALGALMRITWALLFLPYALCVLRGWRAWLLALASGAAFAALFGWWSSPYPYNFPSQFRGLLTRSLSDALAHFFSHLQSNLTRLGNATLLETLLRVQYAGLLVVALVASVPGLRRSAGRLAGLFDRPREWHFHTLNLGLALAFNVALNDTALWRDYRSLSPHLLLSLLVLVGSRRYALVAVLVLSSAVCSIAFVETARDLWNRQFTFDTAQIEAFAEATEGLIEYIPDAENPWCNTVLTLLIPMQGQGAFYPGLMALDRGIGVSFYAFMEHIRKPLKSRWLITTESNYRQFADELNVLPMASFAEGDIYLNLDADCPA